MYRGMKTSIFPDGRRNFGPSNQGNQEHKEIVFHRNKSSLNFIAFVTLIDYLSAALDRLISDMSGVFGLFISLLRWLLCFNLESFTIKWSRSVCLFKKYFNDTCSASAVHSHTRTESSADVWR